MSKNPASKFIDQSGQQRVHPSSDIFVNGNRNGNSKYYIFVNGNGNKNENYFKNVNEIETIIKDAKTKQKRKLFQNENCTTLLECPFVN